MVPGHLGAFGRRLSVLAFQVTHRPTARVMVVALYPTPLPWSPLDLKLWRPQGI